MEQLADGGGGQGVELDPHRHAAGDHVGHLFLEEGGELAAPEAAHEALYVAGRAQGQELREDVDPHLHRGVVHELEVIDQHGLAVGADLAHDLEAGLGEAGLQARALQRAVPQLGEPGGQGLAHPLREGVVGVAVEVPAHEAYVGRVGHVHVAGAGQLVDEGALAGEEVGGQARLAHPGLAAEEDQLALLPGLLHQRPLALAPRQHRRAQHGGREHRRPRPGGGTRQLGAALDQPHELERLGQRLGAQLVVQHALALLEGGQGGPAVADEVVQADHLAVGLLGKGLDAGPHLGIGQRLLGVARLLEPRRLAAGGVGAQLPQLLAGALEPLLEVGAVVVAQLAQQLGLLGQQLERGGLEVGQPLDVHLGLGRELQAVLAQHQVAGGQPQAAQQLAHVVARGGLAGVGPQPARQPVLVHRPLQGQVGQHGGGLALEGEASLGGVEAGGAEEAEPVGHVFFPRAAIVRARGGGEKRSRGWGAALSQASHRPCPKLPCVTGKVPEQQWRSL